MAPLVPENSCSNRKLSTGAKRKGIAFNLRSIKSSFKVFKATGGEVYLEKRLFRP